MSYHQFLQKIQSRRQHIKWLFIGLIIGVAIVLPTSALVAQSPWVTQQAEIVVRKLPDGRLEFCLDVGLGEELTRQCPRLRMLNYAEVETNIWNRSTPILITNPDTDIQALDPATGLYRTKAGDSMASVSEKFNISIPDLVRLNPDVGIILRSGQILSVDITLAPAVIVGTVRTDAEVISGTYTVVSGDSLGAIAARFDISTKRILELNPSVTNPNSLSIGQILIVEEKTKTAPAESSNAKTVYTVQAGDSLNSIARKFSVSVLALREANNIEDADFLSIGQKLSIPSD
ncbi:MAG TPA: LysM peptidoglycan-binding domain-containing protein [Dehalococcoidia bacterium]|nr:LysM peptidoglycan-binding domain-containing protein [Dehalococcoidia bacterium]